MVDNLSSAAARCYDACGRSPERHFRILHDMPPDMPRESQPRAAWLFFGALFALFFGCAPLTQPQPAANTSANSAAPTPADSVSAVVRHLEQKRSADSVAVGQPYIAVVPLADLSGFRQGVWDLELELAGLLSTAMQGQPHWRVVHHSAVAQAVGTYRKLTREEVLEAGRILEADLVVSGSIVDYDMKRISAGDPYVGGYKSYTGVIELQLVVLRVLDGSELGRVESKQESVNRGLGLDLLGKPREEDVRLMDLAQMIFGSTEFHATLLGQVTDAAMEELVGKLKRLVSPTSLSLVGEPAKIVSKYQEEVYINLGSEIGLHVGYRFEVFPGPARIVAQEAPQRIGVVEVISVIGARLSRVRVLDGYYAIEADDRLRLIEIEAPQDDAP